MSKDPQGIDPAKKDQDKRNLHHSGPGSEAMEPNPSNMPTKPGGSQASSHGQSGNAPAEPNSQQGGKQANQLGQQGQPSQPGQQSNKQTGHPANPQQGEQQGGQSGPSQQPNPSKQGGTGGANCDVPTNTPGQRQQSGGANPGGTHPGMGLVGRIGEGAKPDQGGKAKQGKPGAAPNDQDSE